jgi:hypothetical protein
MHWDRSYRYENRFFFRSTLILATAYRGESGMLFEFPPQLGNPTIIHPLLSDVMKCHCPEDRNHSVQKDAKKCIKAQGMFVQAEYR